MNIVVCQSFQELSTPALYDALQLRNEVFVVEQRCIYQDLDNVDKHSYHLFIYGQADILIAYARLIPPGITYRESSIGRIVTREHGKGLGKTLMTEAISRMELLFGKQPIRIGAQL